VGIVMSAPPLTADRDGAVAIIRLNRPDTLNALDAELVSALAAELERTAGDSSVRAVVLTGSGGSFCSGAKARNSGLPNVKL
jgi:enoyl-CoA hydratase/carnithine racemase